MKYLIFNQPKAVHTEHTRIMAELQQYLRDNLANSSLSKICKDLSIKVSSHKDYSNLLLFKYTNIAVSFDNICTRQARGIILDSNDNWKIISYPYEKFFNYGERHAATIDWSTCKIYEKLDGCLMTLYHYDNQWLVSSSGKPDAGGAASKDSSMTLSDVFWEIWKTQKYNLPDNTDMCYIFEMLTDKNPVKIKYDENDVILHGARNVKTLLEQNPNDIAAMFGWKCIEIHDVAKDPDTVTQFVNSRSGIDYEGIIVCDADFRRLKIKSHAYVSIVYSLSCLGNRPELSRKRLFELIVSGNNNDLSELCNAFPELCSVATDVEKQIINVCNKIQIEYDIIKDLGTPRRFAEEAKKTKYTTCMFLLRNNKAKCPMKCLLKCGYDYFAELCK